MFDTLEKLPQLLNHSTMCEVNEFEFLRNISQIEIEDLKFPSLQPRKVNKNNQDPLTVAYSNISVCYHQSERERVHNKVEKSCQISRLQTGPDQSGLVIRGNPPAL